VCCSVLQCVARCDCHSKVPYLLARVCCSVVAVYWNMSMRLRNTPLACKSAFNYLFFLRGWKHLNLSSRVGTLDLVSHHGPQELFSFCSFLGSWGPLWITQSPRIRVTACCLVLQGLLQDHLVCNHTHAYIHMYVCAWERDSEILLEIFYLLTQTYNQVRRLQECIASRDVFFPVPLYIHLNILIHVHVCVRESESIWYIYKHTLHTHAGVY